MRAWAYRSKSTAHLQNSSLLGYECTRENLMDGFIATIDMRFRGLMYQIMQKSHVPITYRPVNPGCLQSKYMISLNKLYNRQCIYLVGGEWLRNPSCEPISFISSSITFPFSTGLSPLPASSPGTSSEAVASSWILCITPSRRKCTWKYSGSFSINISAICKAFTTVLRSLDASMPAICDETGNFSINLFKSSGGE